MAARRRRSRNRYLENLGGLPRSTMLTFGLALLLLLASIGIVGTTLVRRGSAEQASVEPTPEPTPFVALVETPEATPVTPTVRITPSPTTRASAVASATRRTTPTGSPAPAAVGAGPGKGAIGIGGSMAIALGGTLPPAPPPTTVAAVVPTPTRAAASTSPSSPPASTGGGSASSGSSSSSGSSAAAPTRTPTPRPPTSGGSSSSGGGSSSSGGGSSYTPPTPTRTPTPRPPAPTSTPTATPYVAPTATATPTPPPLPAASFPGPGSRTYTYNLTYTQAPGLAAPAATAPAYTVTWDTFTQEDAARLKAALGLTGAIEPVPGGFRVTGGGTLTLSNTGVIFYTAPAGATGAAVTNYALPTITTLTPGPNASPSGAPQPNATATRPAGQPSPTATAPRQLSDADAIAEAKKWLTRVNLLPEGIDAGRVTRPTPEQIVVAFRPAATGGISPEAPMVRVKLGLDGAVRELYHQWPTDLTSRVVTLRDADDAWADVTAGKGYLEVDLTVPASTPAGTIFRGVANATRISIGYAPGVGGATLVPLYVFEGTVMLVNPPAGQPATATFRAYIAATAAP